MISLFRKMQFFKNNLHIFTKLSAHTRMYVCIYVCIYVCTYVCMYVCRT